MAGGNEAVIILLVVLEALVAVIWKGWFFFSSFDCLDIIGFAILIFINLILQLMVPILPHTGDADSVLMLLLSLLAC